MEKLIGGENLNCLRKSPVRTNISGFSLVEILVTGFILTIIFAALSQTLMVGDLSNAVSSAKLEAQAEIMKDMGWIVNDLRQTDRQRLTGLDALLQRKSLDSLKSLDPPTSEDGVFSDPVFNICTGYDMNPVTLVMETQWSLNPISYTFNPALRQITRTDTGTGQTWVFNNISNIEFVKIDNFILHITITGQVTARGAIAPTFTLEQEVKLRNG